MKCVDSADQTPTPTRLIRNCEEVGLFEDLQHVNPFDETFRRAVESDCGNPSESYDSLKCTKPKLATQTTLEALTMHNEETLHTPNVLPYLEAASSSNRNLKTISLDDEILQPIDNSLSKSESMQELSVVHVADESKNEPPQLSIQNEMSAKSVLLISAVAMPYLISTQPTPDPSTIVRPLKKLYPKTVTVVEHPIKEKLKQLILRNETTTKSTHMAKEEVIQNQNAMGKVKPKLRPKIRTTSESVDQKELFERNRAAAQRYRVKVKKTQDFLRQRNTELEAENERLRAELKSLKSILTSHEDCSVTRASNHRIINLQTHYTLENESKHSVFYLIDDKKCKKENSGKS